MTVYIVVEYVPYESEHILKVFSDKNKAIECCEEYKKKSREDECEYSSFLIIERELQ